ncbi:CCAAT-binding factor (CBF)/MAK21 family protein [Cryptosporidium canis]|nr:CCAAT-binding factor (CBF)/MAK21 family protein [Cryptosporidium canis]
MTSSIKTFEKLNTASKSNVNVEMVTKALIDLNKQISETKKIAMEPIPTDILNFGDIDCSGMSISEELTPDNYTSGPIFLLKSQVIEFIKLSSVIMDNPSVYLNNIEINTKLAKCISSNRSKLRVLVVKLFMKWLKDDIMIRNYKNMKEKGNFVENGNFPVSLSTFIIRSILTSSINNDEMSRIILDGRNNTSNDTFIMENILINEYFNIFKDLRYFFLKNILNLLNKCSEGVGHNILNKTKIDGGANNEKINLMTTISLRLYYILINLEIPNKENQLEEINSSERRQADSVFCSYFEGNIDRISKLDKNYRVVYQKLWLRYINIIITNYDDENRIVPLPVLKDSLEFISEFVIPIISNPLELADLFKACFDGASNKINPMDRLAISVISLNGLFYLIVNSRLSEGSHLQNDSEESISSGYYRRLYEILCPPVFSLKVRTKFLKLLSISLFSPLVPMTVLSCFIKKLIRISLFTSTNNTVWIIALVNSLIKKHRNILFPILSLNENDEIYEYVNRILSNTKGELWSYDDDINVYKNSQSWNLMELSMDKSEDFKVNTTNKPNIDCEMGTYLSSNFGLWELYVHNKSVMPVIRHVSNTLTLNASNAHVNHHLHNLNYEELIGLGMEEILVHELSSSNGILHNYSACFNKEKKSTIPYNYFQCNNLSSTYISQVSNKFFTSSDSELFSLI